MPIAKCVDSAQGYVQPVLRKTRTTFKAAPMAKARKRNVATTPFRRLLLNAVWLLGGKGFGAVCSLVYLAILTRTLGLKDFGHFSLIFGTSQALIAFVGFQSWQTVVRYGAQHVHGARWEAFGRLAMLAGMLDVIGAVIGSAIAWLAFYQFADVLDINVSLIDTAFWFNIAALWALVSAPTGIVRALDRFEVSTYVEALVPSGRLLSALFIMWTGPSLERFLLAWALIDIAEAIAYWIAARVLCPEAVRLSHLRHLGQTLEENPGVVGFSATNYASTTIDAAYRFGPLLIVGYVAGTRAAGVFRLAQQVAQGLSKFSTILSRSAYTEISRTRASTGESEYRRLLLQTTGVAVAGSAVVMTLVLLFGRQMMDLLGGAAFAEGYRALIPLTLAACFGLAALAFEPMLHVAGKPSRVLAARVAAVCATAAALAILLPRQGIEGAAWSVALGGATNFLVLGLLASLTLRTRKAGSRTQAQEAG